MASETGRTAARYQVSTGSMIAFGIYLERDKAHQVDFHIKSSHYNGYQESRYILEQPSSDTYAIDPALTAKEMQ